MRAWWVGLRPAARVAVIVVAALGVLVLLGLALDPATWTENFMRGVEDAMETPR